MKPARTQTFPRTARLLEAGEFAELFRTRPWKRSAHFVVYGRMTGAASARLGIVVGRKTAPRAATRNLVKRTTREAFRAVRDELAGFDVMIRMHRRLDAERGAAAASPAVRRICHEELASLIAVAVAQAARHRLAPAVSSTAPATVQSTTQTMPTRDTSTAAPDSARPATASDTADLRGDR
ncbi:MAG: ribonuclease P protein component [Janthinobacterium lividum]